MKKLRNNLFLVAFAVFACANNFPKVEAANGDITSIQGGGIFNNVDVFRIDSNAQVTFSSYTVSGVAVPHTTFSNQGVTTHAADVTMLGLADVNFGSLTVAQSTTNTTQTGQGNVYTAFLASSTSSALSIAALEGSVICATTTQQGNFITVVVCPAVAANAPWIGVADTATSTGTVINILSAGAWALAQTTGTVNPGDMLMTSSLASGFLQATVTSTNNVVGIALGVGNSAGGLTKVRIR